MSKEIIVPRAFREEFLTRKNPENKKILKNYEKSVDKLLSGCYTVFRRLRERTVGSDYDEGPPVPIPNTEVKLIGAENTWRATARENRKLPTHITACPIG